MVEKSVFLVRRAEKIAHVDMLEGAIEKRRIAGNYRAVEKLEKFWFRAVETLESYEEEHKWYLK